MSDENETAADHVRVGFNTGLLDVLSQIITTQALLANIEPSEFATLLRAMVLQIQKQGGNSVYVAARVVPASTLAEQIGRLTLDQLLNDVRGSKFSVIKGGLSEAPE